MNINNNIQKLNPLDFAEPKEKAPKLALLDDFDGTPSGFPHGQAVESVLLSHSDLRDEDIQRVQNTPKETDLAALHVDQKMGLLAAYRTTVVRNVASFYLGTASNLHRILDQQPSVKVISQSQGQTPGRLFTTLVERLRTQESTREGAKKALGLSPDTSFKELCQVLISEAETAVANSELCQDAKSHYDKASKAVHDAGITYLVAAGNDGYVGDLLDQLGVKAGPDTFRNILVNKYVTVVGALTQDGQPAQLNSPGAAIEVSRLGEEVPWTAGEGFDTQGVDEGTSLATPIAAADAIKFLEENPGAQPFEVEAHLAGIEAYRVGAGQNLGTANGQVLYGDGRLESYIEEKIGVGFITDLQSADAAQFASGPKNFLTGLEGKKDHEFQLLKIRPDDNDKRVFTVETYFDEGKHVLQATEADGKWDPKSVIEELHLDNARKQRIENQES